MCTLAVAYRVDPRWPVTVAANRDERLARPSEGWAIREPPGAPPFAAPRDLVGGGTWIGVSSRGLFAAVTNCYVPGGRFPDPERRSRGELVPRALAAGTAAEARAAAADLDPGRFNPFHLLVADAGSAFVRWYDGDRSGLEDLAPGLHVVTEESHDGSGPRGALVRRAWPLHPDAARLRELLATHGEGRQDSLCVHLGEYGTRSSSVLRLGGSLAHGELFASDGAPCRAALEDRSDLLARLDRAAPRSP